MQRLQEKYAAVTARTSKFGMRCADRSAGEAPSVVQWESSQSQKRMAPKRKVRSSGVRLRAAVRNRVRSDFTRAGSKPKPVGVQRVFATGAAARSPSPGEVLQQHRNCTVEQELQRRRQSVLCSAGGREI